MNLPPRSKPGFWSKLHKYYAYGRSALGVAKDAYGIYNGVKSGDWSDLYRYMPRDLTTYFRKRADDEADNEWEDRILLTDHRDYYYDDELYCVCHKQC